MQIYINTHTQTFGSVQLNIIFDNYLQSISLVYTNNISMFTNRSPGNMYALKLPGLSQL